jgi:hypothetical protein
MACARAVSQTAAPIPSRRQHNFNKCVSLQHAQHIAPLALQWLLNHAVMPTEKKVRLKVSFKAGLRWLFV